MTELNVDSVRTAIAKALSVLPAEDIRKFALDGYVQVREERQTSLVAA